MLSFAIIGAAAFVVSALTLFSGFGLGTLLMPVFALFFTIPVAVGSTAVVHGANNLFKVALLYRNARVPIILRFGLPAVLMAFLSFFLARHDMRLARACILMAFTTLPLFLLVVPWD